MSLASLHNIKNNHFSFIVADSAVGAETSEFRHARESSSGGARNENFSFYPSLLSFIKQLQSFSPISSYFRYIIFVQS